VARFKKGVCPFRRTFFSLNSNYIQTLYENIMVLISNTGWRYSEIMTLPIKKRNWVFDLFVSLKEDETPEEENY
jgi:hypothetical protein